MLTQAYAPEGELLSENTVIQTLYDALERRFSGQSVLVLIPDHTRTSLLPRLFRPLVELLHDVKKLDFMVALGTHPPLSETQLCQLLGIEQKERLTKYKQVRLFNHTWDSPEKLAKIAILPKERIKEIAGTSWHRSLWVDVPVMINKIIFEYDQLLVLGPTSPHEVVGFSGGAKYLFPGISGKEIIDTTHWLGALMGIRRIIGIKDTPVREMIHSAAEYVPLPITLIGLVVVEHGLAGVFIGDPIEAWSVAADLSLKCHVLSFDKPFDRVLSKASAMYDELWTGAKALYKLEPVVADGGEVILYAPHLGVISRTHDETIYEIGYHVLEYFLKQWDQFKQIPLRVLAHSTHVRGEGKWDGQIEKPRINVTLSSQISKEDCERLGLGYLDPSSVDLADWQNREEEGILFVPDAGEILYRLRTE